MVRRTGIALLIGYATFQVVLALGAPLGRLAWGGAHRVLPPGFRIASAVAAAVYVGLAVLLARGTGRGHEPHRAVRLVLTIAGVAFAVGVPLNLASPSPPERIHALGAAALAASLLATARSRAAAA